MKDGNSTGPGTGRIITAVLLGVIAVGLLLGSLFPAQARVRGEAVSLPDFFLAVGASAAVASVFFFLSDQIKRAEVRTDETIGELHREFSSLSEELKRRAAERTTSAQQAARGVGGVGGVQELLDLSAAASKRGLGSSLCVALRDRWQLSLVSTWAEGHVGPVQQTNWLGVEQVPEHVREPSGPTFDPAHWHPRQEAVVQLLTNESIADAIDRLRAELDRKQAFWLGFPEDAERALRNLSTAMGALLEVESLKVGPVEVVLDDRYVLTRPVPEKRLLVDIHDTSSPVTLQLEDGAERLDAPAILSHPLVARHLDYQRKAAKQAENLLKRKRATRAMNRRFRAR